MVSLAARGSSLRSDRQMVEEELARVLLPSSAGKVGEAMGYSVLGQGQRIRPILAIRISRLAGFEGEHTLRAAAAVELLHCASLTVDDLPCMDDTSVRRNRPAVHRAYGEATAILASFGLVALAARTIVEQRCTPAEVSSLIGFQVELLKALDVSGLVGGQDLDLRLQGDEREARRLHVNELKTVPLFDLAAHAGLMFNDPASLLSRSLRRFAREFGVAFQMVDDYVDGEITDEGEVSSQLDRTRHALIPLSPAAGELEELVDYLSARCVTTQAEPDRSHR